MPIYISSNVIKNNFLKIVKMYNKIPMIVLKSNAYGLGLKNIIPILEQTECETLVVHSINEAMEIRAITNRFTIILLENKKIPNKQTLLDYKILPLINSLDDLLEIKKLEIPCCLNIDVGMNRTGLKPQEVIDNLPSIEQMKGNILHILAHLHITHETPMAEINKLEKTILDSLLERILPILGTEMIVSLCSSNALEFGKEYIYTAPRIGKAIYGLVHKNYDLEEAISIRESLSFVKKVYPGEVVGYNGYKILHESYLGIVSVGYAHGIGICFANKMQVKYKNSFYKVISVSMEYIIIDFQWVKPEVDEEIIFFSNGFVKECNEYGVYYLEQLVRMWNMPKIVL